MRKREDALFWQNIEINKKKKYKVKNVFEKQLMQSPFFLILKSKTEQLNIIIRNRYKQIILQLQIMNLIEPLELAFENYLNQPTSQLFQHKVYSMLTGTKLGLTNKRANSQELLTKFKIMKLHFRPLLRKKWHRIEKQILVALLAVTCGKNKKEPKQLLDKDWIQISKFMLWNSQQCRNKYLSAMTQLQNKQWSLEEDRLLTMLVAQNNFNAKWTIVAKMFNSRSQRNRQVFRNSRCCKQRWFNHLDPRVVKGDWTLEDDIELLSLIMEHGKSWSKLSKKTSKIRTQNSLKNRFNSLLLKKKSHKGVTKNKVEAILAQKKNQWLEKNNLTEIPVPTPRLAANPHDYYCQQAVQPCRLIFFTDQGQCLGQESYFNFNSMDMAGSCFQPIFTFNYD